MIPANEGREGLIGITELRNELGGVGSIIAFSDQIVDFYKSECLTAEHKKDPVVKDMLKLITPEMISLLPLTEWMRADLQAIDKELSDGPYKSFIRDGLGGKGFMQINKMTYNDLMKTGATSRTLKKFFSDFWKWGQEIPSFSELISAPKNNWDASRNVEYNLVFSLATMIRKYQIISSVCKKNGVNLQKLDLQTKRKLMLVSYTSTQLAQAVKLAKVGGNPLKVLNIDWVREKRGKIITNPQLALRQFDSNLTSRARLKYTR